VESEPTRMCALYVGLPDLKVVAVEADRDGRFVSLVEQTCERSPAFRVAGRGRG
jgi:hypothetical protein